MGRHVAGSVGDDPDPLTEERSFGAPGSRHRAASPQDDALPATQPLTVLSLPQPATGPERTGRYLCRLGGAPSEHGVSWTRVDGQALPMDNPPRSAVGERSRTALRSATGRRG